MSAWFSRWDPAAPEVCVSVANPPAVSPGCDSFSAMDAMLITATSCAATTLVVYPDALSPGLRLALNTYVKGPEVVLTVWKMALKDDPFTRSTVTCCPVMSLSTVRYRSRLSLSSDAPLPTLGEPPPPLALRRHAVKL